jgi:hypothetical protein
MGRLAACFNQHVQKDSLTDCLLHAAYMGVCTAIAVAICAPLLGVAQQPLNYAFSALCFFFDTANYAAASTAPVFLNQN